MDSLITQHNITPDLNLKKKLSLANIKSIACIGPIGFGKTTFAKIISSLLEAGLHKEKVGNNDLLELLYEDFSRYPTVQLGLLVQKVDLWVGAYHGKKEFNVFDRSIYGDLAFQRTARKLGHMNEDQEIICNEALISSSKRILNKYNRSNGVGDFYDMHIFPKISIEEAFKRSEERRLKKPKERDMEKGKVDEDYIRILADSYENIVVPYLINNSPSVIVEIDNSNKINIERLKDIISEVSWDYSNNKKRIFKF